jgi:hypothetical protein
VAKLQAEVQTLIEQQKQAQAFLKNIDRHLDVIEIDEDDACRTITPTKPPTKRRRTEQQTGSENHGTSLAASRPNQGSAGNDNEEESDSDRLSCLSDLVCGDTESDEEYTPVEATPPKRIDPAGSLSATCRRPSTTHSRSPTGARDDPCWIDEMHSFLIFIPHGTKNTKKSISVPNARTDIRQVRRLTSGDGITYKHWPTGTIFAPNERIHLSTTNFDQLFDRAKAWEERYGKDKGNGWLLKHPIMKLKIYQQHVQDQSRSETNQTTT